MQGLAACAASHHNGCNGSAAQDMGPCRLCQTPSHHTGSDSSCRSQCIYQQGWSSAMSSEVVSRLQGGTAVRSLDLLPLVLGTCRHRLVAE